MSRHALVTGAGTGIGEAISRQLHAEGYRVTLLGRRREPLAALSAKLGENSHAVSGDVTDRAGIAAAFATARERFGDIEILVNSAGMAPTAPFHRLDFTGWQRTMDVNVNGVVDVDIDDVDINVDVDFDVDVGTRNWRPVRLLGQLEFSRCPY